MSCLHGFCRLDAHIVRMALQEWHAHVMTKREQKVEDLVKVGLYQQRQAGRRKSMALSVLQDYASIKK